MMLARSASAQTCTGGAFVADACRRTVDLVNFLTPQLATAQAGGNATLGQGGALGGFGRVAVDIRVSAVFGSLPRLGGAGFSSRESSSSFASESHLIPALSANAAIGLWRGISLGVTHVGGVDALVTATYLQNFRSDGVSGQVEGNEQFGYGVRIGVLEESVLSPGVALTWLKRDLPTLAVTATVPGSGAANPGGTISVTDYSIKTSAWRVTAAKTFPGFGALSAGVGQDQYGSDSRVAVNVNGGGTANSVTSMTMRRTSMFGGVSINVVVAKLVLELGRVTGGDAPPLLNDFGSAANTSRTYFTAGVRASF